MELSSDVRNIVKRDSLNVMFLTLGYSSDISSGVGTHVIELARTLSENGAKVTVVSHSTNKTYSTEENGVSVHYVSARAATQTKAASTSMTGGIVEFNRDLADYVINEILPLDPPDIIHYQHWYTFPAAYKINTQCNIPIVGTIHFLTYPVEKWWGFSPDPEVAEQERIWFKKGDRFMACSQSIKDLVEEYHPDSEGKIDVVRNSCSANIFLESTASADNLKKLRESIVSSSSESIVLFVGRINQQKGLEALLESAALVVKEIPGVRYLIAGSSDNRQYYQSIQTHMEGIPAIKDKVTFLGYVPREKVALLYQVADLAVFPSVYEPLGIVAAEAMAWGKATIVTNVGGLGEIVKNEITGLHVEVDKSASDGIHKVNVDELAAAQLRLLRSPTLRTKLGEAAREYTQSDYSFENATFYPALNIYSEVLSRDSKMKRENLEEELV